MTPGKPLPREYAQENLELLDRGAGNLMPCIEIARGFGMPVVVAINRFPTDTDAELELARAAAEKSGAEAAVVADHWARGGKGATELAEAVVAACEKPSNFRLLNPEDMPIRAKIETICKKVYLAAGVKYESQAEK